MRRVMPLGAIAAWSALAVSAVVVAWSLPIDDFWLSIASGRAIAAGADPATPLPFSWTTERATALNPQWGAQMLLGAHGSLSIALVVNAAMLATGLALAAVRSAFRASGIAVAVALLVVLTALAPHLLARAQSFSIALFPLALLLLERGRSRWWLPPAYAVLMLVWANLHGAFVVGQLAAGVWLVAAVVRREPVGAPLLTAVAAGTAPILNPAGPALLAYAWGQPATAVVTAISVEWQPSWPRIPVAMPFWAILAGVVTGRLVRWRTTPVTDLLLLGLLAILAITAIRHIPWFLIAALPIAAADIEAALHRFPRVRTALSASAPPLNGRRFVASLVVISLVVVAGQALRPVAPVGLARLTPDEPVAMVDLLDESVQPGDRVLNEQVWGGYLAYRLWPRALTAMDGRLEIRSRDVWTEYFALMQGRDDPAAKLAALDVSWTLVRPQRSTLVTALLSAGWVTVGRDDYAILLRTPS